MKYIFFTLLLLPIIIGCSNNNPQGRVSVRGEVTLDGKPLEQGNISFLSLPGSVPKIATGASIKNGKFSLPLEHGIIPDQEYSVQFHSVEEIPGTRKETDNPLEVIAETRDIIPPRYRGAGSKETIIATKKTPNVFQFDLTNDK
jgi:hypothetical protein